MYLQQLARHRHIADGTRSGSLTTDNIHSASGHLTFGGRVEDNKIAFVVALDEIKANNYLVSYNVNFTGSIAETSAAFAGITLDCYTFVYDYLPISLTLEENFVSLPCVSNSIGDSTGSLSLSAEGSVLIPVLQKTDTQKQYAVILLSSARSDGDLDGYCGAQVTTYSKEYDYWQPTK